MFSYINILLYMDILYNIWLYANMWIRYIITFNWTGVQLTQASTFTNMNIWICHTCSLLHMLYYNTFIYSYIWMYIPHVNWTVVHLIHTRSHCLIMRTKRETCLTLNMSPLQARKGFSGMSTHKNPIPCNLLFLFCLFIYRYKQLI